MSDLILEENNTNEFINSDAVAREYIDVDNETDIATQSVENGEEKSKRQKRVG